MSATKARALDKSGPRTSLGIQGRLILLLLVVLVPILLIQSLIYYDGFQARKAEELQANVEIARAVGRAFEAFVMDVLHQELAIGMAATASPPLSQGDLKGLLEASAKDIPAVRSLTWISPEGRTLISNDPQAMGLDVSERPYFQQIVSGREWTISDLLVSKVDGEPLFTVSRGIRDERRSLLGVVTAAILPDRLDSVLAIERTHEGGISVLDSRGMLVYRFPHLELKWDERRWAERVKAFQEALEGREATESHPEAVSDGRRRLIAAAPIPSIGWVAGAQRQEEEALRAITSALIRHGGLFLSVALSAFLVALIISRTIAHPIKRMRWELKSFRDLGQEARFAVGGPAEIQELAAAFNATLAGLREIQDRLRLAKEAARLGIYDYDVASGTIQWDERSRELWGVGPDVPITCELFLSGLHPEDRAPTRAAVDRALDPNGYGDCFAEYRVRASGVERWVAATGKAFFEAGQAVRLVGTVQDITERKRAEEALRRSEARLNRTQEIAHLGSWELDLIANELTWSDEAYRIFGLDRQEFGATYEAFLERVHPEDRQAVDEAYSDSIRDGRNTYEIEHRIVRKDTGEVRTVHEKCEHLRDNTGKIVRSVGMVHDITERRRMEEALRETEERFRLAANAARMGFYLRDLQTGENYWSPEFLLIYGLGPRDPLPLEDGIPACIHSEDRQRVLEEARARLDRALEPVFNSEHRIVLPKGEIRWVMIRGRVEFDDQDRPLRSHGFVMDITERKQMEEELRKSRDELELRVQERTDQLVQVVEQLRESGKKLRFLSAKLLMAQEEERKRISCELHDSIGSALSAIKFGLEEEVRQGSFRPESLVRLVSLTQQTIEEARRMMADLRPSLLDDVGLLATLEWFTHQFQSVYSRIHIERHIECEEEEIPEPLKIVIYRIVQEAFHNLAKYSRAEFVELSLAKRNGALDLRIEDNGVGFDPGEVFSRKSLNRGVGLTSMKERAELLGGVFSIESARGEGTRLKAVWPLVEGQEVGPAESQDPRGGKEETLSRTTTGMQPAADGLESRTEGQMPDPIRELGTLRAAVAQQRRMEEEFNHGGERYRAVVEDQTELVSRFLPDGTLTFVNRAYCRFFGESPAELMGKTFWHHMPEEDQRIFREHLLKMGKEHPVALIEHRVIDATGSVRWQQWTDRAILSPQGEIVEFQAVGRDVTERKRMEEALKRSEEQLRALVERSPIAMAVTNLEGEIEYLNSKVIETFGYSHEEIPTLRDWAIRAFPREGYRKEVGEYWKGEVKRAIREGTEVGPVVYRITCKDGSVREVEIRASVIGGKLFTTVSDITEQSRLIEALRESEQKLRHLSSKLLTLQEEERALIARELHDSISQSLSAIKIGVEHALISQDGKQIQALSGVLPLIQRAIQDVRSIYMGLRPSILDDFGLLATLRWLAKEFHSIHPELAIEQNLEMAEHEIPDELKLVLFRVAQQALENVALHSRATYAALSLSKEGDRITLSVEDEGVGFEVQSAFGMAGNPCQGIGLASMKERVELSGGTFSIESVVGEGTCIRASWLL